MKKLADQELYEAIEYARNINEEDGQKILNDFHRKQQIVADTIFNIFPALIAEINIDMSNVFMELCFDAICVYQYSFGKAPEQTKGWLEAQMTMLELELKALDSSQSMHDKFRSNLVNNMVEKTRNGLIQIKLFDVMKESIDGFSVESVSQASYIKMRQKQYTKITSF